ncbi:MAG: DUF362 domain-containing protein, partial [Candidatus Sumerlaeia bacterium]|nr:DUF362 domain-containing protein [Candidatus Sumerlaeia bacterium]
MNRRKFLKRAAVVGTWTTLTSSVPVPFLPTARAASGPPARAEVPRWKPTEPANQPIGIGQGIFPGRVVWVHNPKSALWDGNPQSGGWFEDKFNDPALADEMFRQSLRTLCGAKTDADAWAALFRHYNRTHGRGDVGYKSGERVAVKVNMNCSSRHENAIQGYYNTPQVTAALMRSLVKQAGVRESDLVVYDASRFIPDSIFQPIHAEFPDIRFEDRDGGDGRFKAEPDKKVALQFGDPATPDHGKTYLPACVTGATYLINAAVLKGHSLAAVTLCAKNHFGSVYRENTGPSDPHKGWYPSNMHDSIMVRSRPMGSYNALVDLMAHKDLGGKTILYLIDALYAAPHQNQALEKWQSPPFNGHWPCSLFASQDPVAIESVAVDFFAAEPTARLMVGAVDNYLH